MTLEELEKTLQLLDDAINRKRISIAHTAGYKADRWTMDRALLCQTPFGELSITVDKPYNVRVHLSREPVNFIGKDAPEAVAHDVFTFKNAMAIEIQRCKSKGDMVTAVMKACEERKESLSQFIVFITHTE